MSYNIIDTKLLTTSASCFVTWSAHALRASSSRTAANVCQWHHKGPRLHLPCWQSLAKFFFLWGLHQEICCRPPYISSNSLHPIKKILLRFCNQCLPKITFLLREGLKNMLSDFLSLLRACSNLLIPCFSDNWFVMFTFPVIVNP